MRRSFVTAVILALVVGVSVAPATARYRRLAPKTKTADYDRATGTFTGNSYVEFDPEADGTVASFSFNSRYDHVRLTVADNAGSSVYGIARLGTGTIEFCGTTGEAIALPRGRGPLKIELWAGHCPDLTTPSVVTTGTITARFLDRF